MNHIQTLLDQMRDEESLHARTDLIRQSDHHGSTRANLDAEYTRCPHCDRATVLIEHEWTPQLSMEPSEDRQAIYFTCEWCNGEIEPAVIAPKTPRKPATSAGWEDETEWARRLRA